MSQEKRYRHELKYKIPYGEYLAMRKRLQLVMKRDSHTTGDGRYQTRRRYFYTH